MIKLCQWSMSRNAIEHVQGMIEVITVLVLATMKDVSVTIYFQSRESQEAALKELERCALAADPSMSISKDDSYAAVYGLKMPEALMREVFIEGPDIQFRAGWETGRASEPAFMDMNLHALRRSAPPKVVLYQYDATNELNPHGLLIAYAEEYERHQKKIRSVKPVVSDFDTFTIGSIGMTYEPLPESQADLMLWSLEQARGILSKPGQQSWNSRWLEVLQKANREGFHPTIPQYGFGDPTSYRLVEEVVKATSISGAVRHGAECFNFYFPQEFDSEYLVVWHGFPDKPWAYYDMTALQAFLKDRISEGFCFPVNPVWPVRDLGWYEIFSALQGREDAQNCLASWFLPHKNVVERIESIHNSFPGGFQTAKVTWFTLPCELFWILWMIFFNSTSNLPKHSGLGCPLGHIGPRCTPFPGWDLWWFRSRRTCQSVALSSQATVEEIENSHTAFSRTKQLDQ